MSTLDCLIDYVNKWRSSNGITYSGKLESDDYIKFAQDLQNEIANNVSFSMDSSKTLILYTGDNSDGGKLYSDVGAFCKNLYASGEYLIDYSAISHVTEICNRDTRSGNIIIMTLWNGKKNIGYDKMFLEEFIYLKNKLQHHN